MLLCNLPKDILTIVLGKYVGIGDNATHDLKRNLPLLAVCRLWRSLAIPLVYNGVFVQHGDQPRRRNGRLTRKPIVEEPTNVAVRTNVGLVAMAGCANAVKRVQIDVHFCVNPFPGWREVIQRMRAVASRWRVVELKVAMHPDPSHFDARNVDMAKYTDAIAEVGDALVALMPDVRRLECGGLNHNPIVRSLYGRLACFYAGQLRWFDSRHPITVPLDCQFTRLQRAIINYGHVPGNQLPRIMPGELVCMRLVNGPQNHPWATFSADSDSRVIEFTKLKQLDVAYYATYQEVEEGVAVRHRDGHPWKLHFPSLERLSIYCSQRVCPLLTYAVLPYYVESISVDMSSAAYQNIANVVLPASRRLSLGIMPVSVGDPSGLPAVNHILENARVRETLELKIEDHKLQLAPESITCTTLTHLQISAPITVDTMLAFVERLPHLFQLALHNLNLSDIQTDMLIPDADEDAIVEPLRAPLRVLTIGYVIAGYSPDTAVTLVKYMLLRISTLAELHAAQTPNIPVLGFVEAYALRHPHLSSVKLTLN